MYTIDTLNLSNNPKIIEGLKDDLGAENFKDVTIQAIDVKFNFEEKTWIIGYRFTGPNLKSYREIIYTLSDLPKAEKDWILDVMDRSEAKGLTEPEFSNAVEILT